MDGKLRYITCMVDDAHDGMRVYDVLRGQLGASDGSVRRAKQTPLGLLLDGEPTWANARVLAGQRVSLVIAGPGVPGSSTHLVPDNVPVTIVHADADVVVAQKPVGLVMYPCPGHPDSTLANRLAGWLGERAATCGLHAVHRLDAGTSGLVAFALNSFAKERMQSQLHTSAFTREYLAICLGSPEDAAGIVQAPIGKLSTRPNVYGVTEMGKPALTRYRVMREFRAPDGTPVALLRVRLETGRTHQIRIHLAHIGHPLLGDAAYGSTSPFIGRPALHAASLSFVHPVTGESLAFSSSLPGDMQRIMQDGM